MPNAEIITEVPEDVALLANVCWMHNAVLDVHAEPFDEESAYHDELQKFAGRDVEIRFEDTDDPVSPVWDTLKVLDEAKAWYLAVSDSFEERSRGLRIEARVILGRGGVQELKTHPWAEGEPSTDLKSILAAGHSEAAAEEVLSRLRLPGPAAPKPR